MARPLEYLKIHNWDRWQTYRKDRGQPPWIKIHRRIMRNIEWVSLSDVDRGQLVAIWLLAADHNGVIPASPEIIQKLCFMSNPPNIKKFIDLGFIDSPDSELTPERRQDDDSVTPERRQHVTPKAEAEAEEKRIDKKGEKIKAFSLPSQEIINESSIPKIQIDLNKICDELYEAKIFPEVHAFKNTMLKKGKNERSVLHTLSRCYLKKTFDKDGGPWAYCLKIINIEDGNYNERDYLKTVPASDPPF